MRSLIRTIFRSLLPLLFFMGLGTLPAYAAPMTYVFTGTASGQLGDFTFINRQLTITAVGDTSAVQFTYAYFLDFAGGAASFSVDGVGSGTFNQGTYVFDNQTGFGGSVGFGLGSDIIQIHDEDFDSAVFSTYDLKSAIGPIGFVTDPSVSDWINLQTSLGPMTITSYTNVSFQATVPPSVAQPLNTSGPTTADFSANGSENQMTFDFTSANGQISCNGQPEGACPATGLQLVTTNVPLSNDPTWQPYVIGTPFATSLCTGRPANGPGNPCSLLVNECYGGSISAAQASDFYCPFINTPPSAGNYITMTDTWSPVTPKPCPSASACGPGFTFSLINFVPNSPTETWAASLSSPNPVCTNPDGTGGNNSPGQCDFSDSLVEIYGDQATTRGRVPGNKGWLISVYNVPMPLTAVSANGQLLNSPGIYNPSASAGLWVKPPVNLSFLVNPACPSALNTFPCPLPTPVTYNYFSPAPVAVENFTLTDLLGNVVSGPTAATPPAGFNTASVLPITFTGFVGGLADGSYLLQYGSGDNVGINERYISVVPAVGGASGTCPIPADAGGGTVSASPQGTCYLTQPFKAQLNVDSTPPVITITTPAPGQVVSANSSLASAFTCVDGGSGTAPLPSGCNGTLSPSAANIASGGLLDTKPSGPGLTLKNLTVNSVDNVNNHSIPDIVNYSVSCHYASVNLKSPVLSKGISFDPAATMLTDCSPTAQKVFITLTLTGPFGASCSANTRVSTQLLFPFPIPALIYANENRVPLPGVLLIVPKNACSGYPYTFSTNTYANVNSKVGPLLDTYTQAVTVK